MKLLEKPSNYAPDPAECARAMLAVIPGVMRLIRADLRQHRHAELSVAQFRAMAFLQAQPGASLSELAGHIGLALPSISKLVEGLVARGLVDRQEDVADRRRVTLCLTRGGSQAMQEALAATEANLAQQLDGLDAEQRVAVIAAMSALDTLLPREEHRGRRHVTRP